VDFKVVSRLAQNRFASLLLRLFDLLVKHVREVFHRGGGAMPQRSEGGDGQHVRPSAVQGRNSTLRKGLFPSLSFRTLGCPLQREAMGAAKGGFTRQRRSGSARERVQLATREGVLRGAQGRRERVSAALAHKLPSSSRGLRVALGSERRARTTWSSCPDCSSRGSHVARGEPCDVME
jgi:hypothetical protein